MRWAHRLLSFVYVSLFLFPVMMLAEYTSGLPLWEVCLCAAPGLIVATLMSAFFPRRYRIIGVIVIILLNIGIGFVIFDGLLSLTALLLLGICEIAVLGASGSFDGNPVMFREFGFGAALYGAMYVVFFVGMAQEKLPLLSAVCVVYLVYSIAMMNFNAVSVAGRPFRKDGGRIPFSLRSGNLVLTFVFIAISLALVNIGAVKDGFFYAASQIVMFVLWLISLWSGGPSEQQEGEGGDFSMGALFGDEAKGLPAWLEAFLNVIIYVIVGAVLLALLGLVGYVLYKGIRKLAALIRKWFGVQAGEDFGGVGYTDERSKLQRVQVEKEEKGPRLGFIARLTHRLPKWRDLDGRARVRYALQRVMYPDRHSMPDATRTAHEIVTGVLSAGAAKGLKALSREGARPASAEESAFAAAYDRARYSSGEISADDVERARRIARED